MPSSMATGTASQPKRPARSLVDIVSFLLRSPCFSRQKVVCNLTESSAAGAAPYSQVHIRLLFRHAMAPFEQSFGSNYNPPAGHLVLQVGQQLLHGGSELTPLQHSL